MSAPEPTETATPRPACGWCDSTHIADVSCSCTTPCQQGWCPAAVEADVVVPGPRVA